LKVLKNQKVYYGNEKSALLALAEPFADKDCTPDEEAREKSKQSWEAVTAFSLTVHEANELAKQVKYEELKALFLSTQFFAHYSAEHVDPH